MKYITDTDFLPEYRDLHFDSYQLLYGIAINQQEGMIYDTIITLCRKYREPILRKSKVDYWKTLVDKVISRLDYIDDKADVMVYLPYKQKLCTPERLIQRYSYARLVLENVRGLEMNQLIRRGNKSADDIRWFYPIKKLEDMMYEAVPILAELHHKTEKEVKKIVVNELIRRGIEATDANPSEENENLYKQIIKQLNKPFYENTTFVGTIQKSLIEKEEMFKTLSVMIQAEVLYNLVKKLHRGVATIDLTLLNLDKTMGKLYLSKNITDKDIKLIITSPTGLYKRSIKL